MSKYEQNLDRDASYGVVPGGLPFKAVKSRTYTGTSGLGAQGATTLFTVTGVVAVRVFGACSVDLVGAGTLEVGIAGNTAGILAQIADATTLDAGESYVDGTPATLEAIDFSSGIIIAAGQDIIETIGTADITAGALEYYCMWRPYSSNGSVVAA